MGVFYDQVPANIKDHIMILAKGADKGDNDEYIEAISAPHKPVVEETV